VLAHERARGERQAAAGEEEQADPALTLHAADCRRPSLDLKTYSEGLI
jgi:hypothetical protein